MKLRYASNDSIGSRKEEQINLSQIVQDSVEAQKKKACIAAGLAIWRARRDSNS